MSVDSRDYTQSELEIFNQSNYRCVRCNKPAIVLHELEPKSRRPKTWDEPDNKVALCINCHSWAHEVSCRVSAPILREMKNDRK
jgi:hypothetical protein